MEEVNYDEVFSKVPDGAEYGKLDNELTYYVRRNSEPEKSAVLALAVRVGSILEDDEERRVAHILEHMAFRGTEKYEDVVLELESLGSEFGPCQNAYTTTDETVYEVSVPIENPGALSKVISVFAEISSEISVSRDALEKERGIIMQELRRDMNAKGRIENAHRLMMMGGSKYADREPIGLEKVIMEVTPEAVKQFYKKWYLLKNMAVVAVGDFTDTESVVDLIKTHFGSKVSQSDTMDIPTYSVPSHEEPFVSVLVEPENIGSQVWITTKSATVEQRTINDFKYRFVEWVFGSAINQRLDKRSRKKDPPFFGCTYGSSKVVKPVKEHELKSECKENGTLIALEAMLTEIARVRLYGFSEEEISLARKRSIAGAEDSENPSPESELMCEKYVEHFLHNEPISKCGQQLCKRILPDISASEVSRYAENLQTRHN